jgi:ligand-binding sensor protein/AraC-like DNA-binding protein
MVNKSRFDIKSILDLDKWHKLQDSLSLVTRMAIITVDYKGVPVTAHSYCQSFCQSVRRDPILSSYCQKCDARGGLEAVRLNKPYIYRCHFNILDIAIPIIIENQYIGALMAGQIRLKSSDETMLEQIVTRPTGTKEASAFNGHAEQYAMLPVLPYEEVVTIADMLFHLCTYIVQEAIHKNQVIDMYKKALSTNPAYEAAAVNTPDLSYKNFQIIRHELANALIESQVKQTAIQPYQSTNPTLQPAFDYIYNHKNENFSLQAMAQLCHISPTYFSRTFTKETGENFTVYISRLKMEWAKQLLETTDLSIHEIGDNLGFCDSGYFIKTFRKHNEITPAAYRAGYKNKLR